MSEELKPCPFCGSTDVEAEHIYPDVYCVVCRGCAADLGNFGTFQEARTRWNTRSPDKLLSSIHLAVCETIGGKCAESEIPQIIRERLK